MPTPFPGMDPYLERRGLWEEVHTRLNVAIADVLGPRVRPHYRVGVERRVYVVTDTQEKLAGKPDVLVFAPHATPIGTLTMAAPASPMLQVGELPMPEEVIERFLEIRDVETGEVITTIELLSPTNKLTRDGREEYERKRMKVLGSRTHLVEIDLLRAGEPFPIYLKGNGHEGDYRIVVSRAPQRPSADIYVFTVRDPIPDIPIPLRAGEGEPLLPLNQVLHDLYDRASFDMAVDYRQPPEPPLRETDVAWAAELLQRVGYLH